MSNVNAKNLLAFNKALTKAATRVRGDMADFYDTVVMEVFRRIDRRTPVITGLAQWNWQLTVGAPAAGILLLGTAGPPGSAAVFERESKKLDGIPPFSNLFITNNVEYISFLEYVRRSQQHPEGMVEITLTEMRKWLVNVGETPVRK